MTAVVPGAILAGKYRVTRLLGQGGMGMVVEAFHTQLQERVALKFLLPELASRHEFSERFLREARAAVRIKSEHVARVTDVGTLENGAPFMVMEYLDGGDLAGRLASSGPLALHDAVDFVIQAADALADAHAQGIVHRDIKPANLFLSQNSDGTPLVKVLDFGISKVMGDVDGLTKTTTTMGSALYMAPEQMRQAKTVDHRADIYSLAVTLYELLVGTQPYCATTLPELCALVLTGTPTPLRVARPDLPESFAQVLEKAYAREREERHQSIAEVVFALAPYAPPRSQPVIDRIARRANAVGPRAGVMPSNPPPAMHAPHGTGQSAVGLTNATFSTTSAPRTSKAPLLLGIALLAGMGVAGGYFLFLRASPQASSVAAAGAESSGESSGEPPADTSSEANAADAAGLEPSASAAPETTAGASAEAVADPPQSAAPVVAVGRPPPPPRPPVTAAKPPPTATPTAKPTNNVFDRR